MPKNDAQWTQMSEEGRVRAVSSKSTIAIIVIALLACMLGVVQTQAFEGTTQSANGNRVVLSNSGSGAIGADRAAPSMAPALANVSLVLDDGSRDDSIGIGGTAEFLFVNRFTPDVAAFPFRLNEIQVHFASGTGVQVGDDITLVVYENTVGNADPAVGSNFLATYSTTVQSLDVWNTYILPAPVSLNGPGDVLIGVIAMEKPGTSYFPASLDQTASQQRSWAGWWNASPIPNPPTLPPDNTWTLIDTYFPGNWMIRGYGENDQPTYAVYLPFIIQ